MAYGLKDTELQSIRQLLAANGNIEQAILYGSRAKGNYKPFSDVDIALVGNGLSRRDLNKLHAALDESPLPYKFDLSLYSSLKSEELVDHINRRGVVIYRRG